MWHIINLTPNSDFNLFGLTCIEGIGVGNMGRGGRDAPNVDTTSPSPKIKNK